jgi:hypothetical protein
MPDQYDSVPASSILLGAADGGGDGGGGLEHDPPSFAAGAGAGATIVHIKEDHRSDSDDNEEDDQATASSRTFPTSSTFSSAASSSASRSSSSTTALSNNPPAFLGPCFLLLALAYMSSWTVMGSLVSFFKRRHGKPFTLYVCLCLYPSLFHLSPHTHTLTLNPPPSLSLPPGPDFFVKLNCAYYLPGLPLALFQQSYDESFDAKYTSLSTYTCRNLLAFAMLVAVLLLMPSASIEERGGDPTTTTTTTEEENALPTLVLTAVMGVFSWLAHGTATSLVTMFPPSALTYLQTGFRMPELYTLGMLYFLHVGGAHPDVGDLRVLFRVTAGLVGLGACAWVCIMRSKATQAILRLKDQGGGGGEREGGGQGEAQARHRSSSGRRRRAGAGGGNNFDNNNSSSNDHHHPPTSSPSPHEEAPLLLLPSTAGSGRSSFSFSTGTTAAVTNHTTSTTTSTLTSSSSSSYQFAHTPSPQATAAGAGATVRPLTEEEKDYVESAISPCRLALFVTIASSIFQASFLAYVNTSNKHTPIPPTSPSSSPSTAVAAQGYCICEVLYFVRLFADFAGRPLTRILPRFQALSSPTHLVRASLWRLLLLAVFFAYIAWPQVIPQSDVFVSVLVGVFALLSGMLVVLSYEYAAGAVSECKAYQSHAGAVMNLTFQAAAFASVLLGLMFVDLGLCPKAETLS